MASFVANRRALLFALIPSAFACATAAAAIVATGATPPSPQLALGMTVLAVGSLATAAWLARRPDVRYPTWLRLLMAGMALLWCADTAVAGAQLAGREDAASWYGVTVLGATGAILAVIHLMAYRAGAKPTPAGPAGTTAGWTAAKR